MNVPTNCSECGEKLRSAAGWQTGLCDVCRGNPPEWMWWKKKPLLFVAAYPDLEALNVQAAIVGNEYTIAAITATEKPVNYGAAAAGWMLAGPLGAVIANPRSEGAIIVAWSRRANV